MPGEPQHLQLDMLLTDGVILNDSKQNSIPT